MRKVTILSEIDVEHLSFALSNLTRDQIFNLIVDLDNRMLDYDFTVRLKNHFVEVIKSEEDALDWGYDG